MLNDGGKGNAKVIEVDLNVLSKTKGLDELKLFIENQSIVLKDRSEAVNARKRIIDKLKNQITNINTLVTQEGRTVKVAPNYTFSEK